MKKFVMMLVMAAFLMGTIVGCSGTPTTKAPTPPAADKDKDKKDN